MKPALMIAVVFGAVIAGSAGGYVASSFNQQPERTAPRVAAVDTTEKPEDKTDLSPLVSKQGSDISSLRGEIDSLVTRIDKAEGRVSSLETEKASLLAEIANLKKAPPVSGGGGGAVVDADSPSFKEAVAKAIEEKDAADRATRDAEREKQMAEFVANANKQMVDTLTEKLALTSDQIPKIKTIVEDMAAKRRDVFTKAGEARQKGEQFDWGTEMGAINTAATDAVKNELTSAQQTTFAELTGDRGLSALERGFGGMGGGRNQGGGGGRTPRGGGNNN